MVEGEGWIEDCARRGIEDCASVREATASSDCFFPKPVKDSAEPPFLRRAVWKRAHNESARASLAEVSGARETREVRILNQKVVEDSEHFPPPDLPPPSTHTPSAEIAAGRTSARSRGAARGWRPAERDPPGRDPRPRRLPPSPRRQTRPSADAASPSPPRDARLRGVRGAARGVALAPLSLSETAGRAGGAAVDGDGKRRRAPVTAAAASPRSASKASRPWPRRGPRAARPPWAAGAG